MESHRAAVLRSASVLIMDEVSMLNKGHLRVIDVLLRVICDNVRPFGGKVMLFGGDFGQLQPVVTGECELNSTVFENLIIFVLFILIFVPGGRLEESVMASPVFSPLLQPENVTAVTLEQNMRAQTDPGYSEFCSRLTDGTHEVVDPENPDLVEIPPQLCVNTLDELIDFVWPGDVKDATSGCAILTPLNETVNEVNRQILLHRLDPHEPAIELRSADKMVLEDRGLYTTLATIFKTTPTGMPLHLLLLKLGCIVMLLRNMDLQAGLVNGTRLKVQLVSPQVLECLILNGTCAGNVIFLPRLTLPYDGRETCSPFTRHQFPVRLSYAMTINKAQGQTLDRVSVFVLMSSIKIHDVFIFMFLFVLKVGVLLPKPVFAGGQLSVTASRVRRSTDIKFYMDATHKDQSPIRGKRVTRNVVCREVLQKAKLLDPRHPRQRVRSVERGQARPEQSKNIDMTVFLNEGMLGLKRAKTMT